MTNQKTAAGRLSSKVKQTGKENRTQLASSKSTIRMHRKVQRQFGDCNFITEPISTYKIWIADYGPDIKHGPSQITALIKNWTRYIGFLPF